MIDQDEYQGNGETDADGLDQHSGGALGILGEHHEADDEGDEHKQAVDNLADGAFFGAVHLKVDIVLVHITLVVVCG